MTNLYFVLKRIRDWMLKYKFTNWIYNILMKIGLEHLALYLFSFWLHKNPTQRMKDQKQLFLKHAQELKTVYDFLEDDRSRCVFENIIKFRVTSDWACLKKSLGEDNIKTQYFVPEIRFSDHEIIVDCGAYTGDTAKLFYKNIPNCRVISLEPDEKNFESLQKLNLKELKCIKAGVWSADTTLTFSNEGGGTSRGTLSISGGVQVEVRALDHLPECHSATYIKMDVEGAELEALKGAEKIIRERRPKLAICLYHKPQDFFEIPLYIKKLNPDYKLFVHHHTYSAIETVLYAI